MPIYVPQEPKNFTGPDVKRPNLVIFMDLKKVEKTRCRYIDDKKDLTNFVRSFGFLIFVTIVSLASPVYRNTVLELSPVLEFPRCASLILGNVKPSLLLLNFFLSLYSSSFLAFMPAPAALQTLIFQALVFTL